MTDDTELLRRHLRGSQDAFAELVRCHIGAVRGTAVRILRGDVHLADEVTQAVFTGLARKARGLLDRRSLAGWLYLSTHYEAAKAVRSEQRRRDREQKAHVMQLIDSEGSDAPNWEALRPILDDAMRELKELDREALLLRYFQARSLAEVGRGLGTTENAARMRVDRALERLRDRLVKRGVVSSAAALGTVLAAHTPTAVPATLASSVIGAALAAAPACGAGGIAIFMGITKLQMGMAAALAVAGGVTLWSEVKSGAELRAENAGLAAAVAAKTSNGRAPADGTAAASSSSAATPTVQQLRREESDLRRQLAARSAPPSTGTASADPTLDFKQLDKQPVPVKRVRPKYPVELRNTGINGEVLLSFVIGRDGKAGDIIIERATNEAFGEAARTAVEQWEFTPGEKDGKAVRVRVQAPISFNMQRDENGNWF